MAHIPSDPFMLLSFVNMKLRDEYDSLEALCEDLSLEKSTIIEKLEAVGYRYDEGTRQFSG